MSDKVMRYEIVIQQSASNVRSLCVTARQDFKLLGNSFRLVDVKGTAHIFNWNRIVFIKISEDVKAKELDDPKTWEGIGEPAPRGR